MWSPSGAGYQRQCVCRGMHAWKNEEIEKQFHMDWRGGEPLPPAEEVVTYTQPLHLRGAMNTYSLGHLLRDNLMALVDLPLRFGRDPVDFDWVSTAACRN